MAEVDQVAEVGDPARRIVEHADKNGIDMIVIGSHGLGDAAGLLMGSVSHKVTHLAKCPCVILK
jgi:nucleotide-binding universal stress UspA family protein